jgi:hypothetical protein
MATNYCKYSFYRDTNALIVGCTKENQFGNRTLYIRLASDDAKQATQISARAKQAAVSSNPDAKSSSSSASASASASSSAYSNATTDDDKKGGMTALQHAERVRQESEREATACVQLECNGIMVRSLKPEEREILSEIYTSTTIDSARSNCVRAAPSRVLATDAVQQSETFGAPGSAAQWLICATKYSNDIVGDVFVRFHADLPSTADLQITLHADRLAQHEDIDATAVAEPAVRLVKSFLFGEATAQFQHYPALNQLTSTIHADAQQHLGEALTLNGFKLVGTLPHASRKHGEWVDCLLFSVNANATT